MKKIIGLLFCLGLFNGCNQAVTSPNSEKFTSAIQFVNEKYAKNVTDLTQIDPAYLFIYANNLFNKGKKDEALFWFYVAQYRALIIRVMENEKSFLPQPIYQQLAEDAGTPVIGQMIVLGPGLNRGHLYDYIQSGLGISINGYAGSNIDNWIAQLEKVLAFEEAHPFDPYQAVPADQLNKDKQAEAQQRAKGLAEMVKFLKENKAALAEKRAQMENL